MKPYKSCKECKTITNRKEYKILTNPQYRDHYWDEGLTLYPIYRRGFRNPTKQIMSYQVRMYKTWKYNRNTQWK